MTLLILPGELLYVVQIVSFLPAFSHFQVQQAGLFYFTISD